MRSPFLSLTRRAISPRYDHLTDVAFNTLPALTLNRPFGDSLLSLAETEFPITLSGDSTNLPEGSVVNIAVGGLTFSTTTDASGSWTLNLASGALTGLDDGLTQVVVTAVDAAGNPCRLLQALKILQTPPVSADFAVTQFGDNVINISEAASVQQVTGTSTVVAGQTLSVTAGDDAIPLSVTVDASGNWTASLTPEVIASLGSGGTYPDPHNHGSGRKHDRGDQNIYLCDYTDC